jgi:hypothetical protein
MIKVFELNNEFFRFILALFSISYVGAGNIPPHHCVQTGSGAHSASYPRGTSGFFTGGKEAGS